jgi:hypothetical protein
MEALDHYRIGNRREQPHAASSGLHAAAGHDPHAVRIATLARVGHTLTPNESSMALAHELAHLRRGDLWLGWLPAIAQRLFFFHPLAE